MVISDILQGFQRGESIGAISVDIKGFFLNISFEHLWDLDPR